MRDLIANLEAAAEGSRELDQQIAEATGWVVRYYGDIDQFLATKIRANGEGFTHELPRYTASIDAALTLVPEGWRWQAGRYSIDADHCRCELAEIGQVGGFGMGIKVRVQAAGKTVPLAICIAALKARSA